MNGPRSLRVVCCEPSSVRAYAPYGPKTVKVQKPPIEQINRASDAPTSDEALPLLVERPLVLQPSPIASNTRDLLAIVVRHRVLHRRGRRINSVLLDPVKEISLLLLYPLAHEHPHSSELRQTYQSHLSSKSPIYHPKHRSSHDGSNKPSRTRETQCPRTHYDDRVEPCELLSIARDILICDKARAEDNAAEASDHTPAKVVEPSYPT